MDWSLQMVDAALERLLPCDSQRKYELECSRFATEMGIGEADVRLGESWVHDGDPVNRKLWGLCVGAVDYEGPATDESRTRRKGPLTWFELKCLKWAAAGRTGDVKEQRFLPAVHYMANLLQRDVKVVKDAMRKAGPARGRVGFF